MRLLKQRSVAYVSLEVLQAYVNSLNHKKKVSLQDERLSRMIEHVCGMLELLKIL